MLRLTPRITQTLTNLRTWAPCCVICLIKSPAIRADLSRFFRVGHPIMAGFGRRLARIANSVSNIAVIVSGFDSHRPLQILILRANSFETKPKMRPCRKQTLTDGEPALFLWKKTYRGRIVDLNVLHFNAWSSGYSGEERVSGEA